jgi:hypothetical protein
MKLNVMDRITLMGILPAEGSYMTFKILAELKLKLAFSEDELKEFGIEEKDGKIFWQKSEDKEVEIGEKAKDVIKTSLKKLDDLGRINEQNVSLYERFI